MACVPVSGVCLVESKGKPTSYEETKRTLEGCSYLQFKDSPALAISGSTEFALAYLLHLNVADHTGTFAFFGSEAYDSSFNKGFGGNLQQGADGFLSLA